MKSKNDRLAGLVCIVDGAVSGVALSGKPRNVTVNMTPDEAENLAELLRSVITTAILSSEQSVDQDDSAAVVDAWERAWESRGKAIGNGLAEDQVRDCDLAVRMLKKLEGIR